MQHAFNRASHRAQHCVASRCTRRRLVVRSSMLTRDESLPYTGDKQLPKPFAVPLKVTPRTGGSETQHSVLTQGAHNFGELLMACKPLGFVLGQPEEIPDEEAFAQLLTLQPLSDDQRQLLKAMHQSSALELSPELLVEGGAQGQGDAELLDTEALQQVIKRHALSGASQDFPSCVVREEAVSSYRGLWPAAAALPHSCAPSTHEYVIKDVLFVRASEPLGPGQQLTRNYLGMQAFAPLATRRELLKSGWGLHCTCRRCTAEERHEGVRKAVQNAYEQVQVLSEQWVKAHDGGDAAGAKAVQEKLSACTEAIESALREAKLSVEEAAWLEAGAMAISTMVFSMKAAAGELDVEAKEAELRCLEALAAGSEAHIYAAMHNYVQVLISYGDQTLEEERAQERVTLAHTARYGMLQQEVMMRLSEVRFNDVIPMYSQDADGVAAE